MFCEQPQSQQFSDLALGALLHNSRTDAMNLRLGAIPYVFLIAFASQILPRGLRPYSRRFRVIQYQLDRALRAAASVSVSSRFWDPGWLAQRIARRARQALLGTVGLARLGLGFRV